MPAAQSLSAVALAPPDTVMFGGDLDLLGDLGGDGPHLVVAAPDLLGLPQVIESVAIVRAADGAIVHVIPMFAELVAGFGDADGDGSPDFAATPGIWGPGLQVRRASDGALIWEYPAVRVTALDGMGDVDLDGVPDLVVADTMACPCDPSCCNEVLVLSGRDGSVLHEFGLAIELASGLDAAGAGDVDGDGVPDVLFEDINPGSLPWQVGARVASGADGSTVFELNPATNESGPMDLGGLGDVDGDGLAEVFVATNMRLRVAGGPQGAATWEKPWSIGAYMIVEDLPDADFDGVADIAYRLWGSFGSDGASVELLSGADGHAFLAAHVVDEPVFGTALAGLTDVNGDGRGDLAVAATGTWPFLLKPGKVFTLLTAPPVLEGFDPPSMPFAETQQFVPYTAAAVGQFLDLVTSVTVAGQTLHLLEGAVDVQGPGKVLFSVPAPDGLGEVLVSLSTGLATTATLGLGVSDTHPPQVFVPTLVLQQQVFAWSLYGKSDGKGLLLVSPKPDTMSVGGWDVLRDYTVIAAVSLDANGAGTWSEVVAAPALAGLAVWSQLVALQHGILGASQPKSTLIWF
jgi:hypothetical protein